MNKLALEMIRPREETRLVKPTLLLGVIEVVKMRFPQLAIVSRPPRPWASEGFFPGRALGDFSRGSHNDFSKGAKNGEI